MPCIEMKELEASFNKFSERRVAAVPQINERRRGSITGYRGALARMSYLIQVHRLRCTKCLPQKAISVL